MFQAFGSQGALSIKSFGAAVSTSFDTTLSGVACTILLIMMQSLVRSREEALLSTTDQLVEDTLLRHEQDMAATLGVNGLALSPQNHVEIYGRTVDMISGQVREMAAASATLAQQTQILIEALSQTNSEFRLAAAKTEATQKSIDSVQVNLASGFAQIVEAAQNHSGQIANITSQADDLSDKLTDLKDVCSRRRVLTVTEAV